MGTGKNPDLMPETCIASDSEAKKVLTQRPGLDMWLFECLRSGRRYESLSKAITIVIMDANLIHEDTAYHHCFHLYDKSTVSTIPTPWKSTFWR